MKKTLAVVAATALAGLPALAQAADPAYVTDLTTGISDGKTAGLTIIGALALVLVAKITWRIIRGFAK